MSRRAWLARLLLIAECGYTSGCIWSKRKPTVPTRRRAPASGATSRKPSTASRPQTDSGTPERKVTRATGDNDSGARLGQILRPQERDELTDAFDRSLLAARQNLSRISGAALTREQSETVNLVRSLVSRAERARQNDLLVATQLARRADLLSRDLLNVLR